MLPKARKKDLVVQNLDDETLIYDLRTDRAHCLNSSAALVWRFSDGKTDIARIAKKLATASGEAADESVVHLALQRLHKVHLLEPVKGGKSAGEKWTRREVIKGLGKAAAITLPLVTSIIAPEAAQAASCIPTTTCSGSGRTFYVNRCCCTNGGKATQQICDSAKGCINVTKTACNP